MLKKYKDKREEGFTIIEVLIVLAIAGLIILIVFLAVPALQRNSRNTSRRNDVSKVGGSIQEILNNNNGQVSSVDATAITNAIGSNLAYYDFATTAPTVTNAAGANTTTVESLTVVSNAKCDTGGATTATGASPRQFAIMFRVETGTSGSTPVCQEV